MSSYQLKGELEDILRIDPSGAYLFFAQRIKPMKRRISPDFSRIEKMAGGGIWYDFRTYDQAGNAHCVRVYAIESEDGYKDIQQVQLAANSVVVRTYYLSDNIVRDDRDIFGKDFDHVSKMFSRQLAREVSKDALLAAVAVSAAYMLAKPVVKLALKPVRSDSTD